MDYTRHIVKNFTKRYPIWKKILANLGFLIGRFKIRNQKNLLTRGDHKKAIKILKKGDLVLVGGVRRVGSFVIHGSVTHASLYIGAKKVIHSIIDGVEVTKIDALFKEYDTMVIVRPKYKNKDMLKKTIEYTKKQIGKPFDFEFTYTSNPNRFYCTELIYCAFKHAGMRTGIFKDLREKKKVLHPEDLLAENFEIVFHSHNTKIGKTEVKVTSK